MSKCCHGTLAVKNKGEDQTHYWLDRGESVTAGRGIGMRRSVHFDSAKRDW